jgi:hypothetical protein
MMFLAPRTWLMSFNNPLTVSINVIDSQMRRVTTGKSFSISPLYPSYRSLLPTTILPFLLTLAPFKLLDAFELNKHAPIRMTINKVKLQKTIRTRTIRRDKLLD